MTGPKFSKASYVIAAIALIGGAAIVLWQNGVLREQRASLHWPTVPGRILHSEIAYTPGRSHRSGSYRADLNYSYTVNGSRHVSHQVSLWSADLAGYSQTARAFVADHPAGSDVNVYYDPADAKNSVLVPGANEKLNWLLMGAGGLLLLMGLFSVTATLWSRPGIQARLRDPQMRDRVFTLNAGEVRRGMNLFLAHFIAAGFSGMIALAFLLSPLLAAPSSLSGAPPAEPSRWIAGSVFAVIALAVFARAVRKSSPAKCPLCGNLLTMAVFRTAQCPACGTRFAIAGQIPATRQAESPEPSPSPDEAEPDEAEIEREVAEEQEEKYGGKRRWEWTVVCLLSIALTIWYHFQRGISLAPVMGFIALVAAVSAGINWYHWLNPRPSKKPGPPKKPIAAAEEPAHHARPERTVRRPPHTPRQRVITRFEPGRFVDVVGFMAFPAAYLGLLGAFDPKFGAVVWILGVLLAAAGCIFYFLPDTDDDDASEPSKTPGDDSVTGPFLLDFSVILAPPVLLLTYLLSLVWFHRTLDTRGLAWVTAGFPASVGVATGICRQRFIRAQKRKDPKPPAFVPLTLLGLWLGGTFITVVFIVCLLYKLKWLG